MAGAGSGSGKTLATLALLLGLKAQGVDVLPYKCGPDFIDPRHHERVALTPSRNLDLHFTPPERLREDFDREISGRSGAVVEGVMGLYDGLASGRSTFDLARVLGLPVVLVLSARGMAETAAALVRGLVSFREGVSFAGVIATRTGSPRHGEMIARALEEEGLPPLMGVLPRDSHLELPERHLGLSAPGEGGEEKERLFLKALLAHAQQFSWERILPFFSLPSSVFPFPALVPGEAAPESPASLSPEDRHGFMRQLLGLSSEGEGRGASRGPWGAFLGSLRERIVSPLPGGTPGDLFFRSPLGAEAETNEEPAHERGEGRRGALQEADMGDGPERGLRKVQGAHLDSDEGRALAERTGEGKGREERGFVPRPPRLAVALDRAFWFYYHENWEALRREGIEIVFFSPLDDSRLPSGTSGLYFGGGYPESFVRELTQNGSMVEEVREFCLSGRPVYAECGGMLYLTRGPVEDLASRDPGQSPDERPNPDPRERDRPGSRFGTPESPGGMVGILPVRYRLGERLRRLGYAEVTAASGLFAGVPGSLRGHLFHYTTLVEEGPKKVRDPRGTGGLSGRDNDTEGDFSKHDEASSQSRHTSPSSSSFLDRADPAFRHKADGRPEGFTQGGLVASYMHAFFPTNPLYAARLAERLRS
ncbi:MAG: AAA family ATPase [Leptospirillia bacterium]